jgi:GGDEF domain-containing protein
VTTSHRSGCPALGVLLLASTTEIEADLRGDVERVLPNLAVALNDAMSFERLQQVAACAPLTGCYAAFPSSGVGDVDDLLRVADEAMYRAKTAGREQLALAAGR